MQSWLNKFRPVIFPLENSGLEIPVILLDLFVLLTWKHCAPLYTILGHTTITYINKAEVRCGPTVL